LTPVPHTIKKTSANLAWVDGIKAFAIAAILLNHFAESFGEGPWFSSPSQNWPPLQERLAHLFPHGGTLTERIILFLGWLGDMGPGVFILLSGMTLTLSALNRPQRPLEFYKKRLLRIYPLYIAIHLILLVVVKFLFRWDIHLFSASTVLSLMGLRFTGSLFYYINPSWWFIWVILQLYLVFPFLLQLLKKAGVRKFLLITLLLTVASRLAGVTGMIRSINLYDWMTGLFAGTRLFEFTFGMYLGYLLFSGNARFTGFLQNKFRVFYVSAALYLAGFLCSWTYAGSLFSHALISIGLTGVFYALYVLLAKENRFQVVAGWIGKNSFSVFLLHQPLMMYASSRLHGMPKALVLLGIILFSFAAGYLVERLVTVVVRFAGNHTGRIRLFIGSPWYRALVLALTAAALLLSFVFMLGRLQHVKLLMVALLGILAGALLYRIYRRPGNTGGSGSFTGRFLDVVMILSALYLVATPNWLSTFWCVVPVAGLFVLATRSTAYHFAVPGCIVVIVAGMFLAEWMVRKEAPTQVLRWGEYPALQMDSETVYSLKPGKTTHLKYDHYDYFVRTNSMGFSSEEVNLAQKDSNERRILVIGDAFSMPEGLDYDSSYPYLLEQCLRKAYPGYTIRVINGGVTGYGPNEEYAQLKKYIAQVKPDIVLNQFFVNEFDEVNLTKTERQKSIGFFVDHSLREKYFGNDQLPVQLDHTMQKALGLNNRTADYDRSLLFYYEKDARFYRDTVIRKIRSYFEQMNQLCLLNHARYIVMYVPGQIEVEKPAYITYYPRSENLRDTAEFDFDRPGRITGELCARQDIPFIDTRAWLRDAPVQPVYFPASWHWNAQGHNVISNNLCRYFTTHIHL